MFAPSRCHCSILYWMLMFGVCLIMNGAHTKNSINNVRRGTGRVCAHECVTHFGGEVKMRMWTSGAHGNRMDECNVYIYFIYIKPIKSTSKNNFNYYLVCINVVSPFRSFPKLPEQSQAKQCDVFMYAMICLRQYGDNENNNMTDWYWWCFSYYYWCHCNHRHRRRRHCFHYILSIALYEAINTMCRLIRHRLHSQHST